MSDVFFSDLLGGGDSSVACGVAPRGDRATKNPRLAERGLFVPPMVSASNLAPFIGGAAAKVNLVSVLSGPMALGLAGPTLGGDRTSVVSGKSLSVCVVLAGRRFFYKKKYRHN